MSNPKPDRPEDLPALGRWLLFTESETNRKRMVAALAAICALLFVADFFHLRHDKLEIVQTPGFYAVYGFIAFAFIIFATKVLKKLLSRPETYYGDGAVDGEPYPPEELGLKEHGSEERQDG